MKHSDEKMAQWLKSVFEEIQKMTNEFDLIKNETEEKWKGILELVKEEENELKTAEEKRNSSYCFKIFQVVRIWNNVFSTWRLVVRSSRRRKSNFFLNISYVFKLISTLPEISIYNIKE